MGLLTRLLAWFDNSANSDAESKPESGSNSENSPKLNHKGAKETPEPQDDNDGQNLDTHSDAGDSSLKASTSSKAEKPKKSSESLVEDEPQGEIGLDKSKGDNPERSDFSTTETSEELAAEQEKGDSQTQEAPDDTSLSEGNDSKSESRSLQPPISSSEFAELSSFQRDLLTVLAGMETPKGLEVKEELEEYHDEEINHGRLYPNLDTLVDDGLVEKVSLDARSNGYNLTERGIAHLRSRRNWQNEQAGETREYTESVEEESTKELEHQSSNPESVEKGTESSPTPILQDVDIDTSKKQDDKAIQSDRDHSGIADEYTNLAKRAWSNGDIEKAIKHYEEVLNQLQQVNTAAGSGSDISDEIKTTKQNISILTEVKDQRASLKKTLQTAERNFQEAVVSFVTESKTVARIRFRQAREEFKAASEIIDQNNEQLITIPVSVDIEPQEELSENRLDSFDQLEATTVEKLSEENIETAEDLIYEEENLYPTIVTDLMDSDEISPTEQVLLTVLSWWHDQDKYVFEGIGSISKRQKKAAHGFKNSR